MVEDYCRSWFDVWVFYFSSEGITIKVSTDTNRIITSQLEHFISLLSATTTPDGFDINSTHVNQMLVSLQKSLDILPKVITKSLISYEKVLEYIDIYFLCLHCFDLITLELKDDPFVEINYQRKIYVDCLKYWGLYKEVGNTQVVPEMVDEDASKDQPVAMSLEQSEFDKNQMEIEMEDIFEDTILDVDGCDANDPLSVVEAYAAGKKIAAPDNKLLFPAGVISLLIKAVAQNTTGSVLVSEAEDAAEIVLAGCSSYADTDDAVTPIDEAKLSFFKEAIEDMAIESLRCVALAYRTCKAENVPTRDEELDNWQLPEGELILLSIVGIKDPYRPGVKDAMQLCTNDGVKVCMVTGNNIQTAKAIALECGILALDTDATESTLIEGKSFCNMTESQRLEVVDNISVMGMSSPNDKLLLVQALRKKGHVVAVTGDGTNDAPELHEADMGPAMGIQGTEVAKGSSDIIILDDNFASVMKGVRLHFGKFIDYIYGIFGVDYELKLSTRPEKFLEDIETWDKAEADMIRKFRAGLELQLKATTLFANSPFTEGKPNVIIQRSSGRIDSFLSEKFCLKVDQNRVWDAGGKLLSNGATCCHLKQLGKAGMCSQSNTQISLSLEDKTDS